MMYNYKPYDKPLKARYNQYGGEYVVDEETGYYGWSQVEVETVVIGETEDTFVFKLIGPIPIGFHKSRLVKWLESRQLTLFS